MKKLISSLLILSTTVVPAASADPTYHFRYRTDIAINAPENPVDPEEYEEGNDIDAYYVTPVGFDFEKKIPVATQDVALWVKDKGEFPEVIALDDQSGIMAGQGVRDEKEALLYHGYDGAGNRIARAELDFTVFTPVGVGSQVSFYGHTGQYFYGEIPVPEGVEVYHWEPIVDYPAGMTMMGNALQGLAPEAGTYALAWRGYDYSGVEVAFSWGELLVDDGPQIDKIEDQTIDIAMNEWFGLKANVARSVGPLFYRLVAETPQPAGLLFDNDTGRLYGRFDYGTTARFHIQVTDTGDGTIGTSNSFTLTTKPQIPNINELSDRTAYVNSAVNLEVRAQGISSDARWTLVSGKLPEGLALDPRTGTISGTPLKAETQTGLVLEVSGTGMTALRSNTFVFRVIPEKMEGSVEPLIARTNTPFSTKGMKITRGDVAPVTFSASGLAQGMSVDPNTGIVSSTGVAEPGNYGLNLTALNGDGGTLRLVQGITVYNELSISYTNTAVKRLQMLSLAPDTGNSVVGTGKYTLTQGTLPPWLTFEPKNGKFTGRPVAAAEAGQTYGPFVVQVEDATGEKKPSAPFTITVEERAPLSLEQVETKIPRYVSNLVQIFNVKNRYGQASLQLPSGNLGLDSTSTLAFIGDGRLVGRTPDPVGTRYENVMILASDDGEAGKLLGPFSFEVVDPPELRPLDGKMDVTFTWTRGVPFSGVRLPALYGTYGPVVYGFTDSSSGLTIDNDLSVSGMIPDAGTTTYEFTANDDTDRDPAKGVVTLIMQDPMTFPEADNVAGNLGQPIAYEPKLDNAIAPLTFDPTQSGALPKGVYYRNGRISGTPQEQGSFTVSYGVKDAAGTDATVTVTLDVWEPTEFKIEYPAPMPIMQVGKTVTMIKGTTSGALGDVSFAPITSGLPAGIEFMTEVEKVGKGYFTGTPTREGIYNGIKVNATDGGYDRLSTSDDRPADTDVTFVVVPAGTFEIPPPSIKVRAGSPFSTTISASNGLAPTTFSAEVPLLNDIVLSPAGAITGTLPEEGLQTIGTVTATDAAGRRASKGVNVEAVGAVTASIPALLSMKRFDTPSIAVQTGNTIGKMSYSITPSTLPAGLQFDETTGIIGGSPTDIGEFPGFVITATDAYDGTSGSTEPFTIQIGEREQLKVADVPSVISLKQYQVPAQVEPTAEGALPGAVVWDLTPDTLPAGVSFDATTGAITGTPTATFDETAYVLKAVDSKGGDLGTGTISFTLAVDKRDELSATVPQSYVFNQYFDGSVTLQGTNILGKPDWSISPDLPDWMRKSVDGFGNLVLSGKSEEKVGAQTFSVTLNDDYGPATQAQTIDISVGDRKQLGFVETSYHALYETALTQKVDVSNFVGAVTWSYTGTLPPGLSFDTATGTFTGTPTEFGTFSGIRVKAVDEIGGPLGTAEADFTIDVHESGPNIAISPAPEVFLHIGSPVQMGAPQATNVIGKPVFSAQGLEGTGLAINPVDGVVSGTPTRTGVIDFTVSVTDPTGRRPDKAASQRVTVMPAITVSDVPAKFDFVYNYEPDYEGAPMAHNAYRDAVTWSLASGRLPTGVTVDPDTGRLGGKPLELGNFGPITIKADDTLGGTGGTGVSSQFSITVVMNEDPISLTVADYTTYIGKDIVTAAPVVDNAVGEITFFSPDAAALGLSIDPKTGVVTGRIDTLTDAFINISVRDSATLRVTSKPLRLKVVPELRLTYPALMTATQGTAYTQAVSLGYNIGTIRYEKGAGTWPNGISVNATTGAISGTTDDAAALYEGLDVIANVTFNGGMTDTQRSNTFSIRVNPINAVPIIANIANAKLNLGTEGTAIAGFKPTVTDSKARKPWTYAGTTYEISHDISQYGLSFDTTTGQISGTPTKPFIIRDATISVISAAGDRATTAAFWMGVAPAAPLSVQAGLKTSYMTRAGAAFTTEAPVFENYIGNLTLTATGLPIGTKFTAATGLITGNPTVVETDRAVTITATDEFGRKSSHPMKVTIAPAFSASYPGVKQLYTNVAYQTGTTVKADVLAQIAVVGKIGNLTYEATGLPDGLAMANGAFYGQPVLPENQGIDVAFTATIKVTDDHDNSVSSFTIPFKVDSTSHRYWRVRVDSIDRGGYSVDLTDLYAYGYGNRMLRWKSLDYPVLTDWRNSSSSSVSAKVGDMFDLQFDTPQAVDGLQQDSWQNPSYYNKNSVQNATLFYSSDGITYKRYFSADIRQIRYWNEPGSTREP